MKDKSSGNKAISRAEIEKLEKKRKKENDAFGRNDKKEWCTNFF